MSTVYAYVPSPDHLFPNHPERPGRLDQLRLAQFTGLVELPAEPASAQEVCRAHAPALLEQLQAWCAEGPGIIDHAPTYVTNASFDAALRAVGGTLACTRAVLRGEAQNGFAIVRPPGHHAEPGRSMGFCLLANAAIAAKTALAEGLARVAVIDFDVHHGNGTQACLLEDPRAGFFSSQQEGIYPGSGWLHETADSGGRLVNAPLPEGTGVQGFAHLAEAVIAPFVKKFRPEMLIISAGYDAHWRDPLASLALTAGGYYQLSQRLVSLADEFCNGKILFVLEGGYDPANVANGIHAGLAALMGLPQPAVQDDCPYAEPDIEKRIAEIKQVNGL